MPTIYEKAGEAIMSLIASTMQKYHGELHDLGVRVDCLVAENDKGGAVKLHGYACAAVVRVVGLKDRAKGNGDAEIVIDGDRWAHASRTEQVALIDHELQHLEPVKHKKTKAVKRDDLGRPKLKLRLHDYEFGWFNAIASRHGEASYEVRQADQLFTEAGQLYFPFAMRRREPQLAIAQ